MLRIFAVLVALLFAPHDAGARGLLFSGAPSAGGGGVSIAFVTVTEFGTKMNNFTGGVGMRFTVGSANIIVTDLGLYAADVTDTVVTTINLKDATCSTILATVSVDPTGQVGNFVYGHLSSPVTLTAATQYNLYENTTTGGNFWYDEAGTLGTATADGTLDRGTYDETACSAGTNAGHLFGPVNFKYHL